MKQSIPASRLPRDQTRAVLLAALLDDFGLHHFYLGKRYLGMLYLLFCWTGIPGVLASLEAYRYGFMSPEAWAERYNSGMPGKPVPRWLPISLFVAPLVLFAVILAAVHAGYDF